jgi:Exo-beta-D-glucosaminidase Ig-fold domain
LHAQLNLPDYSLSVANISRQAQAGLRLQSRILSLDGHPLAERVDQVNVAANSVATLQPIDLHAWLEKNGIALVQLKLTDSHHAILSNNLYWQSKDSANEHRLTELSPQPIAISARLTSPHEGPVVDVLLENQGREAALAIKLTMLDDAGARVLPVYYQDNYISLLPGESRRISVRCPKSSGQCAQIAVRGWNAQANTVKISTAKE